MNTDLPIRACAGVGLKPQYYTHILQRQPDIGFFEVHAENYMGAGGPPHRYLTAIRERYPLSVHGVGLSIGAGQGLDRMHLQRLAGLLDRYGPALFSEHLAWSTHGSTFYNDLLPVPYTLETLLCVTDHVDEVQQALGCRMLLENPSTYLVCEDSSFSESQFLAEVVRRTGCGLLLDVNNLHVACINHGWDPHRYLNDLPLRYVGEIHLAGHAQDRDEHDAPLLIDSHDRPVAGPVWELYATVLRRIGPAPTLIEWDARLPPWEELHREARRAGRMLRAACRVPGGAQHVAVV